MNDFRQYKGMDATEFLAHYGVGHEKGGHSGRYPWGSGERPMQELGGRTSRRQARRYTKALNKEDQRQAKILRKHLINTDNAWKYDEKARIASAKYGADSKKAKKYAEKTSEYSKKSEISAAELKEAETKTWKIIAEASEKGYDISSTKVLRDATSGQKTVAAFLGGIPAISMYTAGARHQFVEGNEFKVTNTTAKAAGKVRLQLAKQNEDRTYKEYSDAYAKLERTSKDSKDYDALYKDMKTKEKAANNAMIERAMAQHPGESNEKIAKRIAFPVSDVNEYARSRSESNKAWQKVVDIDNNRLSYKTEEELDRARRQAIDEYERIVRKEGNR